jgi:hypothetical protein
MPVDIDVAEYLQTLGRATVGTDMFIGFMPDNPDDCIVVRATQGLPPNVIVNLEQPGFQVMVRNVDHDAGRLAVDTIKTDLHQLTHTTLNGLLYKRIDATGSYTFIGRDEKERTLWSVNFIAQKPVG